MAGRGERERSVAKIGDIAAAAGLHRIHVLAWRDLDDVEAGGSEVHASTIARLWAEAGVDVTMRTSHAQGHPPTAVRDGYQVVRRAGRYLVFPRAAYAELSGRAGRRDALVEIWNGMPFFSPLWDRGPRVVLLHHVHAEMWRMVLGEAPWLARLGDALERRVAPRLYRWSRIVTLSESAKADIVAEMGLRPHRITVVPPGIDPAFRPGGDRDPQPAILAVGRLVPVKRYDALIRAAAAARATVPGLKLTIVGEGYERPAIERQIEALDAGDWVTLTGRVDPDELVRLYREAWVVASASAREGWGMSLTEGSACGTPAVATRIAGHMDAVVDGASGLLADDDSELVSHLVRVLGDAALRDRLAEGALGHARRFTWEATATAVMQTLAGEAERRHRRR